MKLRVHPLVLKLTGVREPKTPLESHVSIYHWAAAALLRGTAGLPETEPACFRDPEIAALRNRVEAIADASIDRGASHVEVVAGGKTLRSHVTSARGSAERPMTDGELDEKFRGQAGLVLAQPRVSALLAACRGVATSSNVGATVGALLRD